MEQLIQVERYGETTWENPVADEMRKTECMCRSCAKLIIGDAKNSCPVALMFYAGCRIYAAAVAVTRCREFVPKTED